MLRPILRTSQRLNIVTSSSSSSSSSLVWKKHVTPTSGCKYYFSTQSGSDAHRPTLSAKLFLEDGTILTGKSFGCHTAVEGEVRNCNGSPCVGSPGGPLSV
jgi:hypothetical protein